MSSTLYVGSPGAGKTFGVTRYSIVPALDRGQRVVTNIPLREAALVDHLGKNLDGLIVLVNDEQILSPHFWFTAEGVGETITKPGDLIVIDEAHAYYGPDKKIKSDNEVFRAVRFQRKYAGGTGNFSTNIVFVTQLYSDITKSLREVCDSMYSMQKLVMVGKPDSYRVDIYADARQAPTRAKPINAQFGNYDPVYYTLYDSYSAGVGGFVSAGPGAEQVVDDRINIWNSPIGWGPFKVSLKKAKWIAVVSGVVLFSGLGYTFYSIVSRPVVPTAETVEAVTSAATPTASGSVPAQPDLSTQAPSDSNDLRLVGFYSFGQATVAVVVDDTGAYRYLTPGTDPETSFELVSAGPATHIRYKGRIVAPWTGPRPSVLSRMMGQPMEKTR